MSARTQLQFSTDSSVHAMFLYNILRGHAKSLSEVNLHVVTILPK